MLFFIVVGIVIGNFFLVIDVVLLFFEILIMVEFFGGIELWFVVIWVNVLFLVKEEIGKVVVVIVIVF